MESVRTAVTAEAGDDTSGVDIRRADMALKQRALDRITPPSSTPGRYKPPDELLAFLEAL
jgi:hypothetical protein